MNRLDRAIEAFEEDDDLATFEEKLLDLGSALNWNVQQLIKSIRKHGLKSKQSEEDEYVHVSCMKLYRDMEKVHSSMKKILKNSGKAVSEIDDKWMDNVRATRSTIGSIVRDLKEVSNG